MATDPNLWTATPTGDRHRGQSPLPTGPLRPRKASGMIHPTADIHTTARIGVDTRVWQWTQIGARASIGANCIVGSQIYIDRDVVVGDRVKIQTGAQLYHGAVVENGVFIGPLACITNDKHPRAVTPDGRLMTDADWRSGSVRVRAGASLGAGAIVLADVTIGRFAM